MRLDKRIYSPRRFPFSRRRATIIPMRKIIFELSLIDQDSETAAFVTTERTYPPGTSDELIQEAYEAWAQDQLECGWYDVDEDDSGDKTKNH